MAHAKHRIDTPAEKSSSSLSLKSGSLFPLYEFSTIVNSSLDLKFILNTLLLTVLGKLLVTKGVVFLKEGIDTFRIEAKKGIVFTPDEMNIANDQIPFDKMEIREGENDIPAWMVKLRECGIVYLHPIVAQNELVAMIGLGKKGFGRAFSQEEKDLLRSMLDIAGTAIEKANVVSQLKSAKREVDIKLQELNTLFELGKEFNLEIDDKKVIRLLTLSLLGHIGVTTYLILLKREEELVPAASRCENIDLILPLLRNFVHIRESVLLKEVEGDEKLGKAASSLSELEMEVIVPMIVKREVKGWLLLGKKLKNESYSKGDIEFLHSLGNLAIISIENARLFKEELEKQKMEDELVIAREIQQGLLPHKLPRLDGFDIAATNIPSSQVGGDYYDVISKSDDEWIIAIGDVSGKGTPAALLMANVQASLRTLVQFDLSPSEMTNQLNDLICRSTGADKFITFFWGLLEITTKKFSYVNAGHNPPIMLRADGSVERLDIGGIILGVFPTVRSYEMGTITLHKGDILFMFTDGINEAMNAEGEEFTEDRLEKILQTVQSENSAVVLKRIHDAIRAHTKGCCQSDDMTMIVLKCVS